MSNHDEQSRNHTQSTPKFFDVSLANWENLNYEQRKQITDNIYSGFMRNSQPDEKNNPDQADQVQKGD